MEEKHLAELRNLISGSSKILCLNPINYDGDSVGSSLAFAQGLLGQGIKVEVLFPEMEKVSEFEHLPGYELLTDQPDIKPDLAIIFDCGSESLVEYVYEIMPELGKKIKLVNVDHHSGKGDWGNLNIIDKEAAAAGEMVFEICQYLNIRVTKEMATCLYESLVYDTWSFRHSNTHSKTLKIAAQLLKAGARFERVTKVYNCYELVTLKIWGMVLNRIKSDPKRGLNLSIISFEDLERIGASKEQVKNSDLINLLNSIPENNLTALITEMEKENWNVSLRTGSDKVNASHLAEIFGGGGHEKAAAFKVNPDFVDLILESV